MRDIGIDVYRRVTVGDNEVRLTEAFSVALQRADIVLATGGLGPTSDDLTAFCLAKALGRPLTFSEEAWQTVLRWVQRRGRQPTESDRKQAFIIEGAMALPNSEGTAPGQALILGNKLAFLLPGPPREMVPMFESQVLPLIRRQYPDLVPIAVRNLKLVGISEARVGELVNDLMDSRNPTLAPYVGSGEIRLRIAARADTREEAARLVAEFESRVRERLGEYIYGQDEDTLESVVGQLLRKKGLSLACAESVTGGLICHRLTQVPGSSLYLKMGVVAYSASAKTSCLGVKPQAAALEAGVNPEVAQSMAESVRLLAGADIGISTTGFAGPEGGTEKEPVGTVYIGLSYAGGHVIDRQTYLGSRHTVKEMASQRALILLWQFLKDYSSSRK